MRLCSTAWLAACLALGSIDAAAQTSPRAYRDWQQRRTPHFTIYYPVELASWADDVATRMESVRDAVSALVGSAPDKRVSVVIDDPLNLSNGSALPVLGRPVIYLWPTPPTPFSSIGDSRSWPDILSVHEYAHIAHLTRPSRNPTERLIWRFAPVPLSPITTKSPRWLVEGYATYVEGQLTGSGRPFGVWRPAILRQRALEGRLPTYGELDLDSGYLGGSQAYLVGSAFIEWLIERRGDSSMVHLWRRMTAKRTRTFPDAFAGVFGAPPNELYGRFTAEVTGRALAAERLSASDSTSGEIVQRVLSDGGAPAVSADGSLLALALSRENETARVVVWSTQAEPDTALERERARMVAQDPEDVPAVQWHPPTRRTIAKLGPAAGLSYGAPRFMPDGRSMLVTRLAGLADGSLRQDLFLWRFRDGGVRRITHGAGIRSADPSPDGRMAVADQCIDGRCDLVLIDIASGSVRRIATGAPAVVYFRPRWSPDGMQIAASVQREGVWRIVLMDAQGEHARLLATGDRVNRYAPSFSRDGSWLLIDSERDGAPNIARLHIGDEREEQLTRVTGAAIAPEPNRRSDDVYFMAMRARGLDLHRVSARATVPERRSLLDSTLAPAVAVTPPRGDSFAVASLEPPRAYGWGPRATVMLPLLNVAPDGVAGGVAFSGTDVVGRYTWLLRGLLGETAAWRGVSVALGVRRWRPLLVGELFSTRLRPTAGGGTAFTPDALDASYSGGVIHADLLRDFLDRQSELHVGVSPGWVNNAEHHDAPRPVGFVEASARFLQSYDDWFAAERLRVHGSGGWIGGDDFARGIGSVSLEVRRKGIGARGDAAYGRIGGTSDAFELFTLGGTPAPLFDGGLWSQRVDMPVTPIGLATGREMATWRVQLLFGVLRPYYWSGSAGDAIGSWHGVWGIDAGTVLPPFSLIGIPAARLLGGIGYSVHTPFRHHLGGYISFTFLP